jgi:hypothetical protein
MTTKEAIEQKLRDVSLSEHEISVWLFVLDNLNEDELKEVLEAIDVPHEALRKLTNNLAAQKEALDNADLDAWVRALKADGELIALHQ